MTVVSVEAGIQKAPSGPCQGRARSLDETFETSRFHVFMLKTLVPDIPRCRRFSSVEEGTIRWPSSGETALETALEDESANSNGLRPEEGFQTREAGGHVFMTRLGLCGIETGKLALSSKQSFGFTAGNRALSHTELPRSRPDLSIANSSSARKALHRVRCSVAPMFVFKLP